MIDKCEMCGGGPGSGCNPKVGKCGRHEKLKNVAKKSVKAFIKIIKEPEFAVLVNKIRKGSTVDDEVIALVRKLSQASND